MNVSERSTGEASRLIEFAVELCASPLPERLARQAKRCLLDNLGCALFGASQPWSTIMTAEVADEAARGAATLIGCGRQASAPGAALVNGTAIHGFELDDLIPAAIVHPGTVIVPAVLAAAEACGASGARVLAALVAGYEATARISLALGVAPSERGFHKTSVVGPVASAIAAGCVMGLNVEQIRCAVGVACSMASGIKAYAGGTGGGMVKRMHAGRSAEAGVRAAQLARRGFTGPAGALDGHLGLLDVFSGASAAPARLAEGLRETWYVDGVWVKAYPICGWIQGVAQLLLDLRGAEALRTEDVRRVVVATSAFAVKHNGNGSPQDEMEAQYSIPYCAALALTGDPGDPAAFRTEAIGDPAKRALAQRVELEVDAECDAVYPTRFGTRIALELASGETRSALTLDPHGTATDPLSDAELRAKFDRLAACSPCRVDGHAIASAVERLDSAADLAELSRLLGGVP